jgi:hypothetical protein
LKLSTLFAKYLYQHKQLNLPGIGSFQVDPSLFVPEPNEKQFAEFLQQIKYTQRTVVSPDDDFINFIRTETGKIRPLAESDLDSFLSDGKIMLNIGKPFHIEGIGTLQKNREGVYAFTPGEPSPGKLQFATQEKPRESEKKSSVFENEPAQSHGMTKFLIFTALVGGIVFIIWAGYNVFKHYNDTSATPSVAAAADTLQHVAPPVDTSRAGSILAAATRIIDSVKSQGSVMPEGYYRFVIEKTASKKRALRRYRQLVENLSDVMMETNADSTAFSLYFKIPAQPADTLRIKDSLKVWYASKMVYVEK